MACFGLTWIIAFRHQHYNTKATQKFQQTWSYVAKVLCLGLSYATTSHIGFEYEILRFLNTLVLFFVKCPSLTHSPPLRATSRVDLNAGTPSYTLQHKVSQKFRPTWTHSRDFLNSRVQPLPQRHISTSNFKSQGFSTNLCCFFTNAYR